MSDSASAQRRALGARLVVLAAFVCYVIVRAGLRPTDGLQAYVDLARGFPDSVESFMRTSLFHPMLGRLLGLNTRPSWMYGYLLLIAGTLIVVYLQLKKVTNNRVQVLMLVLLGSFGTSFFIQVGHYDTLIIIGSLLLVTTRNPFVQFCAVAVMVGANVELAIVSLLMLALVCAVIETAISVARVVVMGASSVSVWYFVSLQLFGSETLTDGRAGFFIDQLKSSLVLNSRTVPLLIFSFYGLCWVPLVLIVASTSTRSKQAVLVLALVIIPSAFTFLTLDGTRVFASLAAASFTAALTASSDRLAERYPSMYRSKPILLASLFIPSVWSYLGDIRAPHGYFYELIYDR